MQTSQSELDIALALALGWTREEIQIANDEALTLMRISPSINPATIAEAAGAAYIPPDDFPWRGEYEIGIYNRHSGPQPLYPDAVPAFSTDRILAEWALETACQRHRWTYRMQSEADLYNTGRQFIVSIVAQPYQHDDTSVYSGCLDPVELLNNNLDALESSHAGVIVHCLLLALTPQKKGAKPA